jgi:hypothetical protein
VARYLPVDPYFGVVVHEPVQLLLGLKDQLRGIVEALHARPLPREDFGKSRFKGCYATSN